MVLNKRYIRNIKNNTSFYICITILTSIIVLAYMALVTSYRIEKDYIYDFKDKSNLEDAQFVTAIPLEDNDIDKYEKKYDLIIEEVKYRDANVSDKDNKKIRLLNQTEKLNKYRISYGEDVNKNNEIVINKLYAKENGYDCGDIITLDDKEYVITGFLLRYDYMFCLEGLSDTFSSADFGIALISDEEFNKIEDSKKNSYYIVKYNKNNENEFRKDLYKNNKTLSYTDAHSNSRITVPGQEVEELDEAINFTLPICMLLMIIIIIVVLGRKIKNERRYIGILTALGYEKNRLAIHYSLLGFIPAFAGAMLGIVLSYAFMGPVAEAVFEGKIEPVPVSYTPGWKDLCVVILVPVVVYTFTVYLTARRIINGKVINMIKGLSQKKKKRMLRMENLNLSFRTKYKIRAIFGNISRSLIVVCGIGLSGTLFVFGYACNDSLDRHVDKSIEETGSYEYEYFLNTILNTNDNKYISKSAKEVLAFSMEVEGYDDLVTIMGTDNNDYFNYVTKEGNKIEIKKGKYYISDMGAMMFGVKKGDKLKLSNVSTLEEYTIEIEDVYKNGSQNIIISDNETVCNIMGLEKGSYNMVMSKEHEDIPDSDIVKIVSKEGLKKQLKENINEGMHDAMIVIILLGGIILVICVYLMVNILLIENIPSISMLKVLGYHDKMINKIMINIYHIFIPFGILIGLISGYGFNKYNFDKSVEAYNTYVESCISGVSILKFVFVVIMSYCISLLLLNKKVKKISMIESLKNYSE